MNTTETDAHAYLARLLTSVAPRCEPLPDLLGLCTQVDNLVTGLRDENERLRKAVRNQAGDALCWVDDPACQQVQALPEREFLESCRRYYGQIRALYGVGEGLPTIAQLEAEVQRLREEVERLPVRCTSEAEAERVRQRLADNRWTDVFHNTHDA